MVKEYTLYRYEGGALRFRHCGVDISVTFRGSGMKSHTSHFITKNQFIQDAIENDPRFGSVIRITAKFAEKEENVEKLVPLKKIKRLPRIQTANDALRYLSEHGVTITDQTDLFEEADKLGVCFPVLEEKRDRYLEMQRAKNGDAKD